MNEIEFSEEIPDLTKADIFSLGMSVYELMIDQELPKNGEEWHSIRNGNLQKLEFLNNFSNSLKNLVKKMISPK